MSALFSRECESGKAHWVRDWFAGKSRREQNKRLHLTGIPLRSIQVGDVVGLRLSD